MQLSNFTMSPQRSLHSIVAIVPHHQVGYTIKCLLAFFLYCSNMSFQKLPLKGADIHL